MKNYHVQSSVQSSFQIGPHFLDVLYHWPIRVSFVLPMNDITSDVLCASVTLTATK